MAFVKPHLPIISQEISFVLNASALLGPITQEIEFDIDAERLLENRRMAKICRESGVQPKITEKGGTSVVDEEGAGLAGNEGGEKLPMIKKPEGELGRPQSGGFNVEDALKWPKDTYTKLHDLVIAECDRKLDTEQTLRAQDTRSIKNICDLMETTFPALKYYEDNWPVRSIIKMHLKNKAGGACCSRNQAAADKVLAAAATAILPSRSRSSKKRGTPQSESDKDKDEDESVSNVSVKKRVRIR